MWRLALFIVIMKNYFQNLKYLFLIHLSGILCFFVFRILLLIANYSFYADLDNKFFYVAKSLFIGLRFDNVVACYIMLLPLGIVLISSLFGVFNRIVMRVVSTFLQVVYILAFAITAANIPYFKYFFNHLNASIYNWLGYTETTLSMMAGEVSYYVYVVVFIAMAYGWIRLTNFYLKQLKRNPAPWNLRSQLYLFPLSCVLVGLTIVGLRGSVYVSPIRTGAAFFCQNPFFNQVGNNPVFNLVRSTLDANSSSNRKLSLLDDAEAVRMVRELLNAAPLSTNQGAVLSRTVESDSALVKGSPNIVLIFMESMSAELMDRHGNNMNLTPFLDSLSRESVYFDHFYSAGNHTNQGVFSTLYSHPSILKRNMMKNSVIPNYYGLPQVLREHQYKNIFFMPHEAQYDNMNGFLLANGFEQLYSQEDYPVLSAANCWGVSDEFLLDYSIPVLTEQSQTNQPFFGVLLTVSNHPPYVIPDHFHPRTQEPETQIVEFADYAIEKFFAQAKKEVWFDNTIFVLVADHGKIWHTPLYTIPTSFNHVPLIIYSPLLKPELYSAPGGQIDIGPTLLGMLGINYENTGLGIDLLKEKRPCMFFTSDDAVGCIDSTYFYIYKPSEKQEQLFHYATKGTEDLKGELPEVTGQLKEYSWSMLQATQYVTDSIMRSRTGM